MKTKGMFWHVHHDVLVEWSDDIRKRIRYVKKAKPKGEIKLRLKLMKPVKGKLPDEVVKAGEASNRAGESYVKAWEACDKAWEAYDKALKRHKKAIEALHRKECPNCPWNGKTILR